MANKNTDSWGVDDQNTQSGELTYDAGLTMTGRADGGGGDGRTAEAETGGGLEVQMRSERFGEFAIFRHRPVCWGILSPENTKTLNPIALGCYPPRPHLYISHPSFNLLSACCYMYIVRVFLQNSYLQLVSRILLSNITLPNFQKIRKEIWNIYYIAYYASAKFYQFYFKMSGLHKKYKWYVKSYRILFTLVFSFFPTCHIWSYFGMKLYMHKNNITHVHDIFSHFLNTQKCDIW
jgi:hypothetical protein